MAMKLAKHRKQVHQNKFHKGKCQKCHLKFSKKYLTSHQKTCKPSHQFAEADYMDKYVAREAQLITKYSTKHIEFGTIVNNRL